MRLPSSKSSTRTVERSDRSGFGGFLFLRSVGEDEDEECMVGSAATVLQVLFATQSKNLNLKEKLEIMDGRTNETNLVAYPGPVHHIRFHGHSHETQSAIER